MTIRHLLTAVTSVAATGVWADPLHSWNDTDAKERIIAFVEEVATFGTDTYVPLRTGLRCSKMTACFGRSSRSISSFSMPSTASCGWVPRNRAS